MTPAAYQDRWTGPQNIREVNSFYQDAASAFFFPRPFRGPPVAHTKNALNKKEIRNNVLK